MLLCFTNIVGHKKSSTVAQMYRVPEVKLNFSLSPFFHPVITCSRIVVTRYELFAKFSSNIRIINVYKLLSRKRCKVNTFPSNATGWTWASVWLWRHITVIIITVCWCAKRKRRIEDINAETDSMQHTARTPAAW